VSGYTSLVFKQHRVDAKGSRKACRQAHGRGGRRQCKKSSGPSLGKWRVERGDVGKNIGGTAGGRKLLRGDFLIQEEGRKHRGARTPGETTRIFLLAKRRGKQGETDLTGGIFRHEED